MQLPTESADLAQIDPPKDMTADKHEETTAALSELIDEEISDEDVLLAEGETDDEDKDDDKDEDDEDEDDEDEDEDDEDEDDEDDEDEDDEDEDEDDDDDDDDDEDEDDDKDVATGDKTDEPDAATDA
jgi:hypothetical protein